MSEFSDRRDSAKGEFAARYAVSDSQCSKAVFFQGKPDTGAILRQLGKMPTLDHRLVRVASPGTTPDLIEVASPTHPQLTA